MDQSGRSTSSRRFWSRGPGTGFEPMETEKCRQQKSLGEKGEEVSVLDGTERRIRF